MSVFSDLLVPLAATAGPVLLLAPVVYALRPQGGRRWLSARPVPARRVLNALAAERKALEKAGVHVPGQFGDTKWTVPATDRDMTGAFPVGAVA